MIITGFRVPVKKPAVSAPAQRRPAQRRRRLFVRLVIRAVPVPLHRVPAPRAIKDLSPRRLKLPAAAPARKDAQFHYFLYFHRGLSFK
jgi:hypothetical protein